MKDHVIKCQSLESVTSVNSHANIMHTHANVPKAVVIAEVEQARTGASALYHLYKSGVVSLGTIVIMTVVPFI